jgi:hypothetical protein
MHKADTYNTDEVISFPQMAVEASWESFLLLGDDGVIIYHFKS